MAPAMKKPAAAPKAKAAAGSKRPSPKASASSSRATKRAHVEAAPPAHLVAQETLFHAAAVQKELQEALTRAAAAEAREEAAREHMKNAQDALTKASSLAQERTERAASAEGELKMLKEVYDQMHQAYSGSMDIIQNVAKALPQPLPLSDNDNLRMLEPSNAPSAEALAKSPKIRSLSPASMQPLPIQLPQSAVESSPGAKTGVGRANAFDNTPSARTPMKEMRRTPDKADKPSDRVPSTPANIDRAMVDKPSTTSEPSSNAEKADPRKVLESLASTEWPKTVNQWGQMQNTIWAGHEPLPQGWVRIWSRQHDNEYYLHVKSKKTTFDIRDVTDGKLSQ